MKKVLARSFVGAAFAVALAGCIIGGKKEGSCQETEPAISCEEPWIGILEQSCADESGAVETSFRFDRAGVADSLRGHQGVLGNVLVDSIQEGDWLFDSSRACYQSDCDGESLSIEVKRAPPEPVWGLLRHNNPVGALIDSGPIILTVIKATQCP